jgi:hypothetical protein
MPISSRRLREKGGKRHAMPRHHNLEEYLTAYLDGACLRDDPKGPLFRTVGRGTAKLTRTVLPQANAYAMIRRRAGAAGIATKLGNHSFQATGTTAYLKNGGTLEEKAAAMASHASTPMTRLYDRWRDEVSLDEVERSSFGLVPLSEKAHQPRGSLAEEPIFPQIRISCNNFYCGDTYKSLSMLHDCAENTDRYRRNVDYASDHQSAPRRLCKKPCS